MTTSHWQRNLSQTTADINADVVIVGGGYVGLSTAFWLTEFRPELKVVVLERGQCGSGASGRNAGFLTLGSASFYKALSLKWGPDKALGIFKFAEESLALVQEHLLKSFPDIKAEPTTSLTLFQSGEQFKKWETPVFKSRDFKFEWRAGNQLPSALQGKFFGAYEVGPEYKINPVQLLSSLKKLLTSRGIQIFENVMASEITSTGVVTEVNSIKASQVVLALNGYLPEFHGQFKDHITPRRAQMLAVELQEEFQCPSLHYDPAERVYWRKVSEKVLIVGGKRLLDERGEEGDFEKLSPVIQKGLEDYLQHQLGLKYKVIDRWSGIMGFTEHELPIVQKISAPLETYVVGGFSGHGMGLGFRTAMDVAKLVTHQQNESFFSPFKKVDFAL